jgi:hypothetical protein
MTNQNDHHLFASFVEHHNRLKKKGDRAITYTRVSTKE